MSFFEDTDGKEYWVAICNDVLDKIVAVVKQPMKPTLERSR